MAFLQAHSIILAVVASLAALAVFCLYKIKKGTAAGGCQNTELTAVKEEVLKLVPFPVVLLSGQYRIIYLNPAAEVLFDSPLRRNLGKPANTLFELQNPQTKIPLKNFLEFRQSKNSAINRSSSIVLCDIRKVLMLG